MPWTFATLENGAQDSITKQITAADIDSFAAITSDTDPIHLDAAFAASTRPGKRTAHSMIIGTLISAVAGTKLPGLGPIFISQSLEYLAPVFLGDTVTAWVRLAEKIPDKKYVILTVWAENQHGVRVARGSMLFLFNKERA